MKTEVKFSKLSGAEIDVLYKLYRLGSVDYNDVPSKSGRDSLTQKGYALVYNNGKGFCLVITLNGIKAFRNGINTEWRGDN